jgi:hypothetical protein
MQQACKKVIPLHVPNALGKIVLSAAGMGLGLLFLPQMHVVCMTCAGILLYGGLLFVTRGITPKDVRALSGRLV